MTDEPYPEVPREVLRPAMTPEKRGTLSARLREKAAGRRNRVGDIWGDWICAEAADTIDALVEALEAVSSLKRVLRDEGLLERVDKALAKART